MGLKKMMIAKNQLGHIVAERDLMSDADNPWLVKLMYAFQDSTYLYLVMEYCGGGDLMVLLIKKDILSESHTRFYMSDSTNRVWGYTFNRNDAQGFKDYAKKANKALEAVN